MSRSLLVLLLAISGLFNVFFGVGYLQARAQADATEASQTAARQVAKELKLDADQKEIYQQLWSGLQEETAVFRDGIALAQRDVVDELSADDPDLNRVRELLTQSAELHQERRLAGAQRFNTFLGVLSPQQRDRFCRRLKRGPGRFDRLLKRFDADGDGQLSEPEMATAREFIESKRGDRDARRLEHLERFDADGDGQLNDEERAALRQWMREQGHDGRGPRGGGRPPRDRLGPGGMGESGQVEDPGDLGPAQDRF